VKVKSDRLKLVQVAGLDPYPKKPEGLIDRTDTRPVGTKDQFTIFKYCRPLSTQSGVILSLKIQQRSSVERKSLKFFEKRLREVSKLIAVANASFRNRLEWRKIDIAHRQYGEVTI
jgi:hypothetical protein